MKKVVAAILSLAALIGLCFQIDHRYALADRLQLVELRLDQKIDLDRMKALQQMNYELRRDYKDKPMPVSVEKTIMLNEQEIRDLQGKHNKGKEK